MMRHHCKNVVQLSILANTSELQLEQLEKAITSMNNLQCLDILWPHGFSELLSVCENLQELTIRVATKGVMEDDIFAILNTTIGVRKWTTQGFLPRMLNIVCKRQVHASGFVKDWLRLNSTSPDEYTSCLRFYSNFKLPMDVFPALPIFQLEFGQSCSPPFVKTSSCGLLGIKEDYLSLTSRTILGRSLHIKPHWSHSV